MASGFTVPSSGIETVQKVFQDHQRQLDGVRGSNSLESAVIGAGGIVIEKDGTIVLLDRHGNVTNALGAGVMRADEASTAASVEIGAGAIRLWDDRRGNPDGFGRIYTDPGAGSRLVRVFPPYSDGTGLENSFTLRGRGPATPGNAWLFSDGAIVIAAQDPSAAKTGSVSISATEVSIDANRLPLYSLPTTSSAANLRLSSDTGAFTVALVTSSARYKQDIEDAVDVDGSAVLSWVVQRWRDRNAVESLGDDARVQLGFIAEQVHETAPEAVDLDDEGQPNALRDREMLAHVVALCQSQAEQIAALTARLDALEAAS